MHCDRQIRRPSDVNSSQRAVTCDHATLQGDGTCKKELQSFYDGNALTLCDKSVKALSVPHLFARNMDSLIILIPGSLEFTFNEGSIWRVAMT